MTQKFIFNGGLNTDDAEYIINSDDWINAHNIDTENIDSGKKGTVGFIKSTKQNINSVNILEGINGNFNSIAKYEDEENRSAYYILYNDQGNYLVLKYDRNIDNGSGNPITVILNENVFYKDGSIVNRGLNLQNELITGICKIGDILIWSDSSNNVCRLNVTRPFTTSSFKVSNKFSPKLIYENITLIRRPPAMILNCNRVTASSIALNDNANFIADNSYQFAYRYTYVDGEQSVLSPYSLLCPTDTLTGNEKPNVIVVTVPLSEWIPVDIQQIDIAVRTGNIGNFKVVKSWNVNNADDLSAINSHNASNTALSFNFFGNYSGYNLDGSYVAKPFESIPLWSKCAEAGKNMLFLSNYLENYDLPSQTSLTASLVTDNFQNTNATGEWWLFQYQLTNSGHPIHTWYLLFVSDITQSGYYFISGVSDGAMPPYPTSEKLSGAIFYGLTADEIASNVQKYHGGYVYWKSLSPISPPANVTITDAFIANSTGRLEFKSLSTYQLAIVFYDNYLRNEGAITNDKLKINIQATPYDPTGINSYFVKYISWSLSNTNAITEIPDWAVYYSIVRTKNQTYQNFISAAIYQFAYYSGNGSSKPYIFTTTGDYSPSPVYEGIAIDISNLNNNKMGYTLQNGDMVQIYLNENEPITLPITGQYAQWILCPLSDLGNAGNINTGNNLFLIYTPYKTSEIEPFYEVGNMYQVVNPGTASRSYGTTAGNLRGDITILQQTGAKNNQYFTENMSSNINDYLNWNTDIGRINSVIPGVNKHINEHGIRFSEPYIFETRINGLSSFDSLNQKDLPIEIGSVNKLKLTSKMQELGNVMIAIGSTGAASIYIGETQVMQQTGDAFVAAQPNVIGTVNPLKGNYGTLNPESVVENKGNVFWYSILKKSVVQYSVNGLFPVNDFKINSFINNRSESLLTIINQGKKVNTPATYDEKNDRYVISFPSVDPIDNGLMQNMIFDDGGAKTIFYNSKNNRWTSSVDWYPELYGSIGDVILMFTNGTIWVWNGDTNGNKPQMPFNNFMGTQYTSSISKIINEEVPLVKYMRNISLETNLPPSYMQMITFYSYSDGSPVYQMTDLYSNELYWKEGIWYGSWFKDTLTPGQPSNYQALQTGNLMRGQWGYLYMEFTPESINNIVQNLVLNSVNLSMQVSSGSKTLPIK